MVVSVSTLIEEPQTNKNIRLSDGSVMRFDGDLIAITMDEDFEESGVRFSGEIGRRNEYRIYSTSDGKYACVHTKFTRWTGEAKQKRAALCSTTEEISKFFGGGWLAQELYAESKLFS